MMAPLMARIVGVLLPCIVPIFASARAEVASLPPESRYVATLQVQDSLGAPLERKVTLDLDDVTIGVALQTLIAKTGVKLIYSSRIVPLARRVSLQVRNVSVRDALAAVLGGTEIEVRSEGDRVLLVRRNASTIAELSDSAQLGEVFGLVTDSSSGQPVEKASVSVKGTGLRGNTNDRGIYRILNVPSGVRVITIRLLGYQPIEKEVTVVEESRVRMDFSLKHGLTRLQEVITTATGRQRRLELGNDITVLNADSIVRSQPISSVTDLLETRVPGLNTQRTSGTPGDPSRLRLRGAASPLRSNDPIVVVDGVRVYAEQSARRAANLANGPITGTDVVTNYATPSPLDYIDPNSIETLEVIKGPSASTFYGQDAANGVIVITTKKGRAGPTRWQAGVDYGRSGMEGRYPDLLLRTGRLLTNSTPVICPSRNSMLACTADSVVAFQLLNDPELTVLDRGHRTALTLGASGGTSTLTYALTGSYQDETGLIKLPAYEAAWFKENVGSSPADWMVRPQQFTQWAMTSRLGARLGVNAELSLTSSLSRQDQQRSQLEQQLGTLMSTYLDRATGTYYQGSVGPDWATYTPLSQETVLSNYYQRATAAATKFTNGVDLTWQVRPWLTLVTTAGLDVQQRADEIFVPSLRFNNGDSTVGMLNYGQGTSILSTVNVRANTTLPIGRGFQFRFAAGADYTGRSITDLSGRTSELAPGTELLGTVIDGVSRNAQDDATYGWYLAPSLNNSRIFLNLGLRLDGGSSYGTNLKLPAFPKLGFSYLLSDESFYPLKSIIPTLRLRAAYGRAGRQPGIVDRFRLYGPQQSQWGDGHFAPSVELAKLGYAGLRPERTTEFEGGFDTDLLDERLSLSLTRYRKTTDDALLNVPVAPSVYGTGVSVLQNIGVIRNTGLEFTVGTQLLRSDRVTWGTDISVSRNRNVVLKLGPGVEPFDVDGGRVAPGYPLFGRWDIPILGYADVNGDGALSSSEIQLGDTAVYVGSALPNYTANFHTTVSLLRGALALTLGLRHENGLAQTNRVAQSLAAFTRGWQDPAASLAEQAATSDIGGVPLSEYNWIQTVSTTRLNSMAVTYTIPQVVAQRFGARSLSLAVQGTNLGLWTNYRGLDPGVNGIPTGNNVVDIGVLPQPRTWQVRVNATY